MIDTGYTGCLGYDYINIQHIVAFQTIRVTKFLLKMLSWIVYISLMSQTESAPEYGWENGDKHWLEDCESIENEKLWSQEIT